MVTYHVHVGERSFEVDVDPRAPGLVTLDGVDLAVDLQQIASGSVYSLLVDGRSFELLVEEVAGEALRVVLGGVVYPVRVEDERARALAAAVGQRRAADGELAVQAPMPGLVVSVAVAPGEEVRAQQRLLVLEAMKMENELRAPRSARVKAVHVAPGEKVEQGRLLVTLG